MDIREQEITALISSESEKFRKTLGKTLLNNHISSIVARTFEKTSGSAVSTESVKKVVGKNLSTFKYTTSVESALMGVSKGTDHIGEIAHTIAKYTSQEAYYREDKVKKAIFAGNPRTFERKTVIDAVSTEFHAKYLQVELSEEMNNEITALFSSKENDLIEEVSGNVIEAVKDAEEKSEVTRTVINEFKEVSDEIKEQRETMAPTEGDTTPETSPAEQEAVAKGEVTPEESPEEGAEGLKFINSTEYIKSMIPCSAMRFAIESDNGKFKKERIMRMLFTLEENSDTYDKDVEFVQKRIQNIIADTADIKDFDVSKATDLESLFKECVKDVNGVFSAHRKIGLGRGDVPAAIKDEDTLQAVKAMVDINSKDQTQRINDMEIIITATPSTVNTSADLIKMAFENLELKVAKSDEIPDYAAHTKAIEVREELIGEFLVDGLQHVPTARAQRLKEMLSGIKGLANTDGLKYSRPKTLKSIYYKTAQIVDPEVLVDFNKEGARVKEMIAQNYGTDKYDSIVDDFFTNRGGSEVHVSSENLYETFAYAGAVEIMSSESDNSIEGSKEGIKTYSKIMTTMVNTLESLNVISKTDLKAYVKTLLKK